MCTIKREWDWRESEKQKGILSLIIPWFYNSCKNQNSANDPIEIGKNTPEAPYMTVLTKNVIGVIGVICD